MSRVFGEAGWARFAPLMFDESRFALGAPEAASAVRLLGCSRGAAVLDLGCGPGRHAIELARLGYRVTGVDVTGSLLEEARGRAAQAGVEVEWVQADMRAFERPGAFDAALVMATSFGYFDDPADDLRVLQCLYASLRPGGALLLDVQSKEVVARTLRGRQWLEQDDMAVMVEQRVRADWEWTDYRFIVVSGGAGDGLRREEFVLSHRLYAASELKDRLIACGFDGVRCFGSLEGAAFDEQAARLIVVAERR